MISVNEAKKIIINNATELAPVKSLLSTALGKVLAEDVYSPINIPAFDQSSMDGYAFSFTDWKQNNKLKIAGEIAAGSSDFFSPAQGSAVRIFTGGAVPPGTDTVVMQEKIKTVNDELIIDDGNLKAG